MRMTPEEKQELDAWVEKEYPKSMKRINSSDPFHQVGKKIIAKGGLSYILFVIIDYNFFKSFAIALLVLGMLVEIIALITYFRSLSNEK